MLQPLPLYSLIRKVKPLLLQSNSHGLQSLQSLLSFCTVEMKVLSHILEFLGDSILADCGTVTANGHVGTLLFSVLEKVLCVTTLEELLGDFAVILGCHHLVTDCRPTSSFWGLSNLRPDGTNDERNGI